MKTPTETSIPATLRTDILNLKEVEIDEDHDEKNADAEVVEDEPASVQLKYPAPPSCLEYQPHPKSKYGMQDANKVHKANASCAGFLERVAIRPNSDQDGCTGRHRSPDCSSTYSLLTDLGRAGVVNRNLG